MRRVADAVLVAVVIINKAFNNKSSISGSHCQVADPDSVKPSCVRSGDLPLAPLDPHSLGMFVV
jgi:hypothetical protein